LAEGGAVAVAGRVGLIWVTGPDAVTFLGGLLSQNVAAIAPGATGRSLLLAPNGKMRATLFLLRGEDRVGLVCDAGRVGNVVEDLGRFRIRIDVTIELDARPTYEVWGAAPPVDEVPVVGLWTEEAGRLAFAMPLARHKLPRWVVIGPVPAAPLVDRAEIAVVRIEAGEPEMGVDLDDRTIPQEGVDVADYVDFTKGCYLGQELVARIDSRGHVNRRLAGLQIEGDRIPDRASPVVREAARSAMSPRPRGRRPGGWSSPWPCCESRSDRVMR